MFVTTDNVWRESLENDSSTRKKAVAINIINGNTIYIKEHVGTYTVDLETTVGVETWQYTVLATFDSEHEANVYADKILDAYGKGIKFLRQIS